MKRIILLMGMLVSIFGLTSCLDNEDMDFVPSANETYHPYHGKDGDEGENNDTIPPPPIPPTGGQQGQNPVKP